MLRSSLDQQQFAAAEAPSTTQLVNQLFRGDLQTSPHADDDANNHSHPQQLQHQPAPPKSAPTSYRPKPLGQIDTGRGTFSGLHPTAPRQPVRAPRAPGSSATTTTSARATSTLLRQLSSIKIPSYSDNSEMGFDDRIHDVFNRLNGFEEELRSIIVCNEVRQRNLIYRSKLVEVSNKEERELLEEEHIVGMALILAEEARSWTGTTTNIASSSSTSSPHLQKRSNATLLSGPFDPSLAMQRIVVEEHSMRSAISHACFSDAAVQDAYSTVLSYNTLHWHAQETRRLEDRCTVEWRELHQRAEIEGNYWEMHVLTQLKCASWLQSSSYIILKQQRENRGVIEDVQEQQGRHRITQDEIQTREILAGEMYQRRRWLAGFDVTGDELRLRGKIDIEEERCYSDILALASVSWNTQRKQTELSRDVMQREEVLRCHVIEEEQKEWTHVATWAHRRWFNIYTAARELIEGPQERDIVYELEVTDSDNDDEAHKDDDDDEGNTQSVVGGRYPMLRALTEVATPDKPTTALQMVLSVGVQHHDFFVSPTPADGNTPIRKASRQLQQQAKKKTKTVTRTVTGSISYTQQEEAFGRRDIIELCWKSLDALRAEMYRQRAPLLARARERLAMVETYIDGRIALLQQEDAQWQKIEYVWSHNHFNVSQRDATRNLSLDEMANRSEIVQEKDAVVIGTIIPFAQTVECLQEEFDERQLLLAKEIRMFKIHFNSNNSPTAPSVIAASLVNIVQEEESDREGLLGDEADLRSLLNIHIRTTLEGGGSNLELKYLRDQELVTRKQMLCDELVDRISNISTPNQIAVEEHYRSQIANLANKSMISAMYIHATKNLEIAHRREIREVREQASRLSIRLLEVEEEETIQRYQRITSLEADVRATLFIFHQRSQPLFVFESDLLAIEREEAKKRMVLESQAELGAHATLKVVREDIYPNTLGRVMDPTTGRNHLLELQESRAVTYITPRDVDEEHRGTLENRAREYVGKATRRVEMERNGGALWRKAPPMAPTTFGMWLLHAFDEIHEDEYEERHLTVEVIEHAERAIIKTVMRETEDRWSILRLQEHLWSATRELWSRIATREVDEYLLQHERTVTRCEEDDRAYIWIQAREETLQLLSHREAFYIQLEEEQKERLLIEQGPLLDEFYSSRFEIATEEHKSINSLLDTLRWGTFILLRRKELESRLIRRDCCTRYYHFQGDIPHHNNIHGDEDTDNDGLPDEVLISEMVEVELHLPAPPTVIKELLPQLWTREELLSRFKEVRDQQQNTAANTDYTSSLDHYTDHARASFAGRELASTTAERDAYLRKVVEGSGELFTQFHSEIVKSIEPEEDVERRRLMGANQHALIALLEKERRRKDLESLKHELNELEGNDNNNVNSNDDDGSCSSVVETPPTAVVASSTPHHEGCPDADESSSSSSAYASPVDGVPPSSQQQHADDVEVSGVNEVESTPQQQDEQSAVEDAASIPGIADNDQQNMNTSSSQVVDDVNTSTLLYTIPPRYAYCSTIQVPIAALQAAADIITDSSNCQPEEHVAEFSVRLRIVTDQDQDGDVGDVPETTTLYLGYAPSQNDPNSPPSSSPPRSSATATNASSPSPSRNGDNDTVLLGPEYLEAADQRWQTILSTFTSNDREANNQQQQQHLQTVRAYFTDVHNTMWMRGEASTSTTTSTHPTWSIPLPLPASTTTAKYNVEITLLATLRHSVTGVIAAQADVMQGVMLISPTDINDSSTIQMPLKPMEIISSIAGSGEVNSGDAAVVTFNIVNRSRKNEGSVGKSAATQQQMLLVSALSSPSFNTPIAATIEAIHELLEVTPFDENNNASVMSSPRSQRCSLSPSSPTKMRRQPSSQQQQQQEDADHRETALTDIINTNDTTTNPADTATVNNEDEYEEEDEL